MARHPRRQYFVNGKVQGSIAFRVAMYWFYCLLAVAVMSSCWMVLFDRPTSSAEFVGRVCVQVIPTLLASVLLMPLVLMDCVRFSNRFVGPMFRLGRALERLGQGQRVHNIEFRNGDYWFEMAQSFNAVNERMISLEQQVKTLEAAGAESPAATPAGMV